LAEAAQDEIQEHLRDALPDAEALNDAVEELFTSSSAGVATIATRWTRPGGGCAGASTQGFCLYVRGGRARKQVDVIARRAGVVRQLSKRLEHTRST
jgi:hypothetical protein